MRNLNSLPDANVNICTKESDSTQTMATVGSRYGLLPQAGGSACSVSPLKKLTKL